MNYVKIEFQDYSELERYAMLSNAKILALRNFHLAKNARAKRAYKRLNQQIADCIPPEVRSFLRSAQLNASCDY